jgi:hypothetical protein
MHKKAWASSIILTITLVTSSSAAALAGQTILFEAPAGDCTLSVEADDSWPALRLRAHHPKYQPCGIGKKAVAEVLRQAFAKTASAPGSAVYTSLFIGRLIDYPWLSQFLALHAAQDPGWDAGRGKPVGGQVNAYAAAVLSAREVVQAIEEPLHASGYSVDGAMVEKVLVGGLENVPLFAGPARKGRFPFDAQVWFRLRRR